jgi:hypothetical protein
MQTDGPAFRHLSAMRKSVIYMHVTWRKCMKHVTSGSLMFSASKIKNVLKLYETSNNLDENSLNKLFQELW